jgi:hypothetical protein
MEGETVNTRQEGRAAGSIAAYARLLNLAALHQLVYYSSFDAVLNKGVIIFTAGPPFSPFSITRRREAWQRIREQQGCSAAHPRMITATRPHQERTSTFTAFVALGDPASDLETFHHFRSDIAAVCSTVAV